MHHLIIRNSRYQVKLSATEFASFSFSAAKIPSVYCSTYEKGLNFFDPFQILNDYAESKHYTLDNTKIAHAQLLRIGSLHSNLFLANSLLGWYCCSGSMADAVKLFVTFPQPNAISWNTIISGYNRNVLFDESWRFFCKMLSMGFEPNDFTYGSVFSACMALQAPILGKQVYSLAIKNGFFSNGYVRSGAIDFFAKCSCFDDALRVFNDVSCGNVVCWNATLNGAVRNGEHWIALDLFCRMGRLPLRPNGFTFSIVLTACAALEELEIGKGVHGFVIKCGAADVFVGTAMIDLYSKCRDMDGAVKVFSLLPVRNVVSWTALISGFAKTDDSINALKAFKEMICTKVEINNYTASSVISACAKPDMIEEAAQIHSWTVKSGFYTDSLIQATLIHAYSKIGVDNLSHQVFKEMEDERNSNVWGVMISTLAQNQSSQSSIELFQRMLEEGVKPDMFCVSSVVSVIGSINLGRQMHCYSLKTGLVLDLSVASSIFTMYSKCGSLEDSYQLFRQIPVQDNVSWASMISGFAEHGCPDRAVQLFRDLLSQETKPDEQILIGTLSACSSLHALRAGKEIHGYALRAGLGKETLLGGALVNIYSKCGMLGLGRRVFDMLHQKDQVAFSSLISGHVECGLVKEALSLLSELLMSGLSIESHSLSSVLKGVADLNESGIGTHLHALIMKTGLNSEVSVGSSLITMYSRCGNIEDSQKAFDEIQMPDLIGWTSMIFSYAQHGKGAEALNVYELMRKAEVKPDPLTFVGVLSACSHSGLVKEGYFYLNSMAGEHGIKPNNHHYACMVDILGRSGRLREAESFINSMPIEPNALVWGALLAACKVHGDIELAQRVVKKVIELEPSDASAYVSLSNLCAEIGQWEDVVEIRGLMKGTGVRKEPGWSST